MKKTFLILFSLVITETVTSQTLLVPKLALEGIDFSIKIDNLPDTLTNIKLEIVNEDYIQVNSFRVVKGKAETTLAINSTGSFEFKLVGIQTGFTKIRVVPGILSLLPPLVAILLALIFRQVIISLMFGVFIGAVFIYNYNPFTAILRLIDTYILNALFDTSHLQIIIFTFLFGGVIGLISKSGGTRGIANLMIRFAKKRRSGLITSWLSGLIIFFDDYANCLIVGNLMRPVTDKMRISREKLSFIVDATAAPVASIFIVSSWIGFEIGLIQDGLNAIGSAENAYNVFLQTIPYRFYPIAMLIFVFMVSYYERDFGPMLSAERRSVTTGKVSRDGVILKNLEDTSNVLGNELTGKARWYNGIIPLLVFIIGTIAALYFTGINSLNEQGNTNYGLREIIGNSNSYLALMWSGFSACIVAAIMILSQKILTLNETVDAWFTGVRSMFLALIILTLAWSIGAITKEMKTTDYIVGMISEGINPKYLPVIVFVACALTSFSTGTSWGTMAIMMPIVIPLAHSVSELNNYGIYDNTLILHGVISSVLAGAVFGDHCSPISDTTILSAIASGCDLMDHVRTQLPYAIVVALLCMIIGDVPTAFGFSPYLSILLIIAGLSLVLYFFGRRVTYERSN